VTHSAMKLNWDAAPGNVRKYIITYKPDEGDMKQVSRPSCLPTFLPSYLPTFLPSYLTVDPSPHRMWTQ